MKLRNIEILETDNNKKGDLFGRLMGDLFHALGYDEPRMNVHKAGRELDLDAIHRTERKYAKAECKGHKDKIGGNEVNKFVGVLDAERKKIKRGEFKNYDVVGYFISLSGFKETALEQENDLDNERVILLKPEKIVDELVKGRILVSIEKAVSSVDSLQGKLTLIDYVDLFAYERGWIWAIYYSDNDGQTISHFALVHAEGKPLIKKLADEIRKLDDKTNKVFTGLNYLTPIVERSNSLTELRETKKKYFKYLENECGEIQFEGLPTDKDAGAVKVKLENIFVPLHLNSIAQDKEKQPSAEDAQRESIGKVLKKNHRLAILAKPGGGKSTLIKRIAVAYAFPNRREAVNDGLPNYKWFPIFIRCRELGEKVTSSITDIISNIPNRAEISHCSKQFTLLVSDALQKGSALLLVDGLDEIAEDRNRIAFVNQLRTFIATYPNINMIVTSREAGFRVVAGSLATYCLHYSLSKLNNSEIEDLTVKWHKAIIDDSEKTINEAKSLASLIIKDRRIKVLAENPLLLTTLLFVKRWVGYLPTKRSVLYQEMIKLLLVTWNVEGHEQLDIDETEPQLAFVAFWMTSNGKQTITEDELKDCLFSARKQMPAILGYTTISVPNFIKSVESRSSLLIMSGYSRLENEEITPVYEFLHLSFQEYLTAKAIAEKYLPEKEAKKSILKILRPHIEKENWKEVIPLVAVLAKKDNQELIEYLINQSKKITEEDKTSQLASEKTHPAFLLGSCIANEIQINPALLETAIEWFAKSYYSISEETVAEIILNSKFGETYRSKVKSCFYDKYEDKFASALGSSLAMIYLHDLNTDAVNEILTFIKNEIKSTSKDKKCTAILALMSFAYSRSSSSPQITDFIDEKGVMDITLSEIYEELVETLKLNDKHYLLSSCWCVSWLESGSLLNDRYRNDLAEKIIRVWLDYEDKIKYFANWALSEILRPTLNIDASQYPNIKQKIFEAYNLTQSKSTKMNAVCLGNLIGIKWNEDEVKDLFKKDNYILGRSYSYFGAVFGIE